MSASYTYATADFSEASETSEPVVELGGKIKRKELRTLARHVRTGHVGPTSVYYAGVTAPAIAAGMATLVAASLDRAHWPEIAVFQASSIVAAMAGISWYLIFMRWSYRHSYGRGTELEFETQVRVDETGVYWSRGAMDVTIGWHGVTDVKFEKKFIRICVKDGDDVILPNSWFAKRSEKKETYQRLKGLLEACGQAENAAG